MCGSSRLVRRAVGGRWTAGGAATCISLNGDDRDDGNGDDDHHPTRFSEVYFLTWRNLLKIVGSRTTMICKTSLTWLNHLWGAANDQLPHKELKVGAGHSSSSSRRPSFFVEILHKLPTHQKKTKCHLVQVNHICIKWSNQLFSGQNLSANNELGGGRFLGIVN